MSNIEREREGSGSSLNHKVEKKKHLFKVLVIGDYAVGKTSLIKIYTEGFFTPNYKLTIGVDFAVKTIEWDDSTQVSLQLWDVAGHERFGTMTRVYYKYAIAAIIVFDVSRPATFEAVSKWREDLNSKVSLANGESIPCILLANKCDLAGVNVDNKALENFSKEHNFVAWFTTSAAQNTNIDEAMKFLVARILDIAESNIPVPPVEKTISINEKQEAHEQPKKSNSCFYNCSY